MNENWTEKLIDTYLETPNTAEPALGFESRLLARVAEQRSARRPVFWMMWAAAAITAAVVVAVILSRPTVQKPGHVDTAKAVTPAQPTANAAVPAVKSKTRLAAQRRPAQKPRQAEMVVATDSRQEVFPAPSPLSEQERLAFEYLRGTPRSEVIAMSRPEPELPQEINQAVPGPEVNRSLPSSTR
jgi:hypothetical protein